MSIRREIDRRLTTLAQISGVMGSMKKLAQMESHKVSRLLQYQQQSLHTIQRAAADFQSAYPLPESLPADQAGAVCVIWGSERGFCGDFNQRLVAQLSALRREDKVPEASYVVIGRRCAIAMQRSGKIGHALPGAGVTDEIQSVLSSLIETLAGCSMGSLTVLSHHADHGGIRAVQVLPPEFTGEETPGFRTPVRLNLKPRVFLKELLDHYLIASLYGLAYESLLAECQQRMQHLDAAMHRIEEQSASLHSKRNMLRQEEITEELEIILLNTATLPGASS